MRASVVIPCYNSLDFLPATVDSVLAQTFGDFELVLVDDGGTDDLTGWAATVDDPRVRVVRQDNAGVSAARNLGIDSARGELVVFLDSDDLWVPDALERLVACFDREPSVGLAYGGWDVIDAAGRPNGRVYISTWEGDVWEQFVIRNPVPASAVAVPRAVLVDLGGFAVNRDRFPIDVEDWELWVRIAAGHRVAVVSDVLVHHRLHDRNSSSDVASLEAAYRHFLDTVFEGVDDDRLALRSLATARTELVLAWQSLNDNQDPDAALGYRRSAARHAPEVRRSVEYWRVGLAATALRAAGDRGYAAVRSGYALARRAAVRLPVPARRSEGSFTP